MKDFLYNYCLLIDFLGKILGPCYEIALYDLRENKNTIIAISNNHITGRNIGAPISDLALGIIMSKYFEHHDYKVNYSGFTTAKDKVLRASTFFIKDTSEALIGLLCINFDDSPYVTLSQQLLHLCHPDFFIHDYTSPATLSTPSCDEQLSLTLSELIESSMAKYMQDKSVPITRLTGKERFGLVEYFHTQGIFSIKGAVKEVAAALHSSEPTIYRYLAKINQS